MRQSVTVPVPVGVRPPLYYYRIQYYNRVVRSGWLCVIQVLQGVVVGLYTYSTTSSMIYESFYFLV